MQRLNVRQTQRRKLRVTFASDYNFLHELPTVFLPELIFQLTIVLRTTSTSGSFVSIKLLFLFGIFGLIRVNIFAMVILMYNRDGLEPDNFIFSSNVWQCLRILSAGHAVLGCNDLHIIVLHFCMIQRSRSVGSSISMSDQRVTVAGRTSRIRWLIKTLYSIKSIISTST